MTSRDLNLIDNTISKHFLFCRLSKIQRLELLQCVHGFTASTGEYIFKQGDLASMFFIIGEGKVSI